MIRKFKFIFVLLFSITLQSQVCSDFPEITATSTTICSGLSTTLSVTYTPPTICNMNITPTTIPLGNPIPGFTYGGLYNGHHYYVHNTPTSWTQGELICRQNGGYLVCINDINENAYVSNLTNNNIWIGLFRDPTTCQFRWLDCMNITFTNWRPGEPNSGPCGEPYTQIIRGCSFGLNTWNNLDDNSANGSCYSNMVPIMEIDPIIYNNPISPTTTYLWSTGETTNSINISPTSTTNYWVDITSGSLTCRKNITINVNPDTPAPTGNPNQVFCANPTPLISDLTVTGIAIQWYATATGGSTLASTTNLVDGTTYYATQTINGCESTTRLAITVDFNDPQITASATTVCNGTAVTLTASNTITPIANNCSLPANLLNGLVGYWPFCGNANDESGNGNNGTVNGATLTTDRFGNPNNAYYFSSSGCSTRIDAQVNTNTIQTGLTISIWVLRVGNGCISPRILEFWPTANPNGPGMAQWGWGNGINTIGIGSITSTGFSCAAGIPVNGDNIWYNIVYTNDGTTGKFYKDGILITSIPSNGNPILAGSAAFGRMNHPAFDNLNGKLDDIGVWNRALSQQEISQLYNSTQISYLWSTGETTETINPTPTATTSYWVDITVNGVTCRKEITIDVNSTTPIPTGNTTQIFCAIPAPTVADLVATGSNIQWYDSLIGGNLITNTTSLVDGSIYYASQTINNCESDGRLAVTVNFNDPQIIASETTVCSGENIVLGVNTISNNINSCTGVSSYYFLDFTLISPIGNYTNLIKKNNEFYLRSFDNVLKSNDLIGPYTSLNFNTQIGINGSGQMLGFDNLNRLHISTNHNGLFLYDSSNWTSNGLIGFGTGGQYFTNLANGRIVISKGGFLRDIYYSDNNGNTWINATNIDVDWNNIVIASNGDIYASSGTGGLNAKGVIKSTDNGSSWSYINSNLGIISSTGIFKDCFDNLFIVGDDKIFKSINNGVSWNIIANIPQIFTSFPLYGQFVVASNGDFYYQGDSYLFFSSNEGITWTQITNIPGSFGTIREIDGNIIVCSNQGLYAKTVSNNTTYLWSTGANTPTINPTLTATTDYWCDVTVNGVTCRKEITITVNPNNTPTFTQVAAICSGATLTALPTTSNNGIIGTWSPALNNTATTTYIFTPDAGQCATTATMTITVNPNVTPTFTQVADICSGATLASLPTTSNNGYTGTWSPALNNTATTTYTFMPDTGQCATTTTMTITVNQLPVIPTGDSLQNFCAIDNPTIGDLVITSNFINWYLEPSGGTPLNPNYSLTDGLSLYAASYDPITNCENPSRYQVIVQVENPAPPFISPQQVFCLENILTLGDINTNGISMIWYDSPVGGNPILPTYILENGDTFYGAATNNVSGCESTTRIPLDISIINSSLEFNNLITVDDNDLNKELIIAGIEQFPNNAIEIYNRYGNLVWSGINYNNISNTFKGMANVSGVVSKGSYLPTGTYFFILSYPNDCEKTELKGFIHIDNKL